MLDARLRRWIDPVVDRVGASIARLGMNANQVTLFGFGLGMAACVSLSLREYQFALALILGNRIADGLDGAVARRSGASDLGAYLDIVCDFLFYSGAVFFFAVGEPSAALPAAFLVFSFVGTGSSFLAFATIAAKRGLVTEARGRKGIYYLGGLTEGAETIAVLTLICFLPSQFAIIAWVFGGMCWLTTFTRVCEAVIAFRAENKEQP